MRRPSPVLSGRPITVGFRRALQIRRGKLVASGGTEVHAACFLRQREIILESALRRHPRELRRIVVHELFHFAWLRLNNTSRRSYEDLISAQMAMRGELGWSAEMRKHSLTARDWQLRTRPWREYVCESFCDTGAWLFAGVGGHGEYTLARDARLTRRTWFRGQGLFRRIPV
jgi:hypothetical protein